MYIDTWRLAWLDFQNTFIHCWYSSAGLVQEMYVFALTLDSYSSSLCLVFPRYFFIQLYFCSAKYANNLRNVRFFIHAHCIHACDHGYMYSHRHANTCHYVQYGLFYWPTPTAPPPYTQSDSHPHTNYLYGGHLIDWSINYWLVDWLIGMAFCWTCSMWKIFQIKCVL